MLKQRRNLVQPLRATWEKTHNFDWNTRTYLYTLRMIMLSYLLMIMLPLLAQKRRKGKVSQVAVTTDIKYRRYWWMVQQSRDFDEWFRWMWGCNWFWFCKEIFLKLSVQNDNSNSTESHGVGGSVALREYIEIKVSLRGKRPQLRFIWSKTSP